ncbi:MAG: Ig-like domain-containing protein, partial [bacterium]
MKQATANKMGAVANLQTTIDSEGNFVSQIDPTKAETQLMRITEGAIAGAAVAIPPSALSIPVSIMVGEGVSLATSSFSQTLGITDNKINVGGPSVSFTASQDVVATNPMTLSIPFGSLSLSLNDANSDNIVVMYRWTIIENGETKFEAGILPGENVTRAKNKVSFQTTKFGTFQVGVAEKKITTAVVARTEEPPALKSCERYAAEMFPSCTTHGQVGCLATDAFRAVDMTFLKADFIISGISIQDLRGNVIVPDSSKVRTGTLYGPSANQIAGTFALTSDNPSLKACERYAGAVYPPCVKDGQVGCVTSLGFKAADMALIKPETILAGRVIAGVPGTVTLPSKDKVIIGTTYGPAGATIAGTSFADKPTLSYVGATGTKIKLGLTMSVDPTSLASNGSNITACNTKTGTATLPAGLIIHPTTCVISGIATQIALPATYTIVATNGMGNSTDADVTLAVLDTAAAPKFSLNSGTYGPSTPISLSTSTPGAAIYYTTDGSSPTTNSALYSSPVILSSTLTFRSIATKNNFFDSVESAASYTVDATPPSNPSVVINNGTNYTATATVDLAFSAADASQLYLTNLPGCNTGGNWETFVTSKTWTLGQTNSTAGVYVKYKDTLGNETACVSDTIIHDTIAPLIPVIADPAKSFYTSFGTSIQQNAPTDINFKEFRYTFNNTDPTCSSGAASSAQPTNVTIPAATTTLKVITCDNAGLASPVQSVTYNYSRIAPTVVISAPTMANANSIPVTITFSSSVTGFDISDIIVDNGIVGSFSGSGNTYSASITPTSQGTVTISVAENSAQDTSNNVNIAAAPVSVIYDSTFPTVEITSTSISSPTNNPSMMLKFTFSEPVTGFDSTDVLLNNATAGSFTAISATVYTLQINATGLNVTAAIAARAANDSAGNGNMASSQWSVIYDNTAPTVAITSNRDPGPTNNSEITLTFTFSEAVTGFTASSVVLTNATSGAFAAISSTVYTLAINPTGTAVSASVPANSATDTASNGNIASTPWSITYDITPPNAPKVTGTTPIANTTAPTWSWTSGGGNGTYRFKLNNADLTTDASQTTNTSFTQTTPLTIGSSHTLYVQERDETGNWSDSGSFVIQLVTIPAAPALTAPTRYNSSLGLSWASVPDATAYNLYWSNNPGVTTTSNKIPNLSFVFTHVGLTGGRTYYYRLAAVKASIEGPLSNEVNAAPYSYPAPTITTITPAIGPAGGGTTISITGNGFINGTTVRIGGNSATGVNFVSSSSITAMTPAGIGGAQDLVVTNPDGQSVTLSSAFRYGFPLEYLVVGGGGGGGSAIGGGGGAGGFRTATDYLVSSGGSYTVTVGGGGAGGAGGATQD